MSVAAAICQVKDTDLKLETAMSLYGLRKFELLWERALDSKALIAWNDDTVVLAFRGTASLANLWADLQVCHEGLVSQLQAPSFG